MGVRGLTTYINFNQQTILKEFLLHDSYLVIDGHSLCAQLYRRLNCFSAFGGDYDRFAAYVKKFFKNLRKCNVIAYVLFDGSYENRKLKTAYSRLRSKINGASKLDPVTQGCLQIFPLLLRDVFIEALSDMNVEYTVCEFEADDEIAAMSRHLNCPVLSYDSDFFIYNVLYIPFNTIELKPVPLDESDNRLCALECKIYRVENLTNHFGGLKEELLPLLATLLGNDYVEKRVFNKFFSQLKLPKSKNKNEQQRCIHGLFKWLQNETLESAIAKILGRLKKAQKDKVLAILNKSIAGYNSTHCESLKYFNIIERDIAAEAVNQLPNNTDSLKCEDITPEGGCTETSPESENESNEENSSDDETKDELLSLPNHIAGKIRNGQIPKPYINLYTHHLFFCSPQAEDYTDNDSALCILPVLRFAFDLVTDFSQEYCIYISREKDCNYKRIFIDKEYSVTRLLDIPYQNLTDEHLKAYFHHFLQQKMELLDLTMIEVLPNNFQLFMIALLWWVANCEVPLANIHSLFISYTMLEVIDEKTGTFRGYNYFNNKHSKKLEELRNTNQNLPNESELFLNKNKVQYEDCLLAASTLLKHFELDDKIKKKPKSYDVKKMHSFAQFQCCLYHFNSLNSLCSFPFETVKYCKSFNGTFVYNIAVKLENQVDPCAFFEQYLKGSMSVLKFYKSLCKVYQRCADVMNLQTFRSTTGKKRRRRKNADSIDKEINFIVKGFESEVII